MQWKQIFAFLFHKIVHLWNLIEINLFANMDLDLFATWLADS